MLVDCDGDAELISNELQRSGLSIVSERVDSADAFTSTLKSFAPDVVISDHSLANVDSPAALEILRAVRPTVPLIIITNGVTGEQSVAAIRAGAEDIILKEYLSRISSSLKEALAVRRPLHKLTERQVQVLRLVSEGYRTREIAERLGLSVKTVESHRGEIMKRLRVHDVASLVRYAVRVGLMSAFDTRTLTASHDDA
jgi:DNA-binding NarL/FixJ family response regulator